MPTMLCPHCGEKLKFEGIATVCPKCARVVRVAAEQQESPAPAQPKIIPPTQRVLLRDIEDVAPPAEETFAPLMHEEPAVSHRLIWQLSIGAGSFLLLAALILIFWPTGRKPAPPPVAVVPPPTIVAAPPPPPPAPPAPVVVAPAPAIQQTPPPSWSLLKPVLPPATPDATLTDQRVGDSIQNGVNYLIGHVVDNKSVGSLTDEGPDCLCVYSLLHASDAISDPRLGTANPLMQGLMQQMRKYDLNVDPATYSHSIRASALALRDRAEDRSTLRKDLDWLVAAASAGHYGYSLPPKDAKPEQVTWDNSNSQYGLLGVWAAAQAGMATTDDYWKNVEGHWLADEKPDGGWGYQSTSPSTLTMTCAGVTSLCVASEQRGVLAGQTVDDAKVAAALARSIKWLGTDDRITDLGSFTGYALYGIERAALATGFKWFGNHNWYRELAASEIKQQSPDGSWGGSRGELVETAFRLLFLSRGRQPLLINKLRFDGRWDNRPRDASKLVEFASAQLERPFAWGVADLTQDWNDWIDCPVLFITTDTPPTWTDEQFQKLHDFTDGGGMIFLNSETPSPEMDAFAAQIATKSFPDQKLTPLLPNHPVYATVFPVKNRPPFKAVSNGERLLMLYSPTDITKSWITRKSKQTDDDSELGLDIFVYAAGLEGFRHRLNTPFIAEPNFKPLGNVPVQQIKYAGHWNPEPGAWLRFPRWFQNQTSLRLAIQPTEIVALNYPDSPIALLSGNTSVDFDAIDLKPLHDFVNNGGVLFIDAAGGSPEFVRSVRDQLLPKVFPEAQPSPVLADDPILAGAGDCMDPLPKPRLRRFASEQLKGEPPAFDSMTIGKGVVIISDLDVSAGLLDTNTWGIAGYTPTYCQSLLKNTILWSLTRYHP